MKKRRRVRPPEQMRDPVSRSEAAALLGFASEFKVRALERSGTLRATRGIMGSAWYTRAEVLAVRAAQATEELPVMAAAVDELPGPQRGRTAPPRTDAELITYLRLPVPAGAPLRTVADLVADMGVSIARAQKVFRFWLANDAHPAAAGIRTARAVPLGRPAVIQTAPDGATPSPERRSPGRVARAGLIRELRAADPAVRKAAFEELKRRRASADAS